MRRVVRRSLVLVLGAPALLVLAVVLYLAFADLSGYRTTVERMITEAIGRELTIGGKFDPSVGRTIRVVAEDVTLANVGWSAEPAMVHVDRIELSIDTWSLVVGPVRLRDMTVHGGRVRLEEGADGRGNWVLDAEDTDPLEADADQGIGVEFGQVELRDVELIYDEPAFDPPLRLHAERLNADPVDGKLLELRFVGEFGMTPLELSGSLSTIERLIVGRDLRADMSGRCGEGRFSLRGSLVRLAGLEGPALSFELQGPDSDRWTAPLGLPSLGSTSYSIVVQARPTGSGVGIDAEVALELLQVEAHGTLDSLVDPEFFDLTLNASAADLAATGALFGMPDLPEETFSVSGRLKRDETRMSFRQVEARVAENVVQLDGVMGEYPTMVETDLTFSATGPDIAKLGALLELQLPEQPFEVKGRILRRHAGVEVDGLQARVGESTLLAEGSIGDPPGYTGTSLDLHVNGPDLSLYSGVAGVVLPADPFELRGQFERSKAGVRLDSVSARLGQCRLAVEGAASTEPGFQGSDLRVQASCPDLSRLGGLLGQENLPASPFEISGRVRPVVDGYRLDGFIARLDDIEVRLDGLLGPLSDLAGTALQVVAEGSDLSALRGLTGTSDLPAEAFRLSGRMRVAENGYDLEALEVKIGGLEADIRGHVATWPEIVGTDLELAIRLNRLSDLNAMVEEPRLPAEPLQLSGRIRAEPVGYTLTNVAGDLGGNRFRLDGVLGPLPDLAGTDAAIELSGPDLAGLGRMIASTGLVELPDLRPERFRVTGRVRIAAGGYEIDNATARVGENELRVSGRLGSPPRFVGSDLSFEGNGPDLTKIVPLSISGLPAQPYRIAARVERLEQGLRFHGVRASLGDYYADVDGYLGEPPRLVGTLLDVRIEGPDPVLFSRFLDLPPLPAEAFSISGHLEGTTEEITLERFSARLGASDLTGSMRIDLQAKPDLRGRFTSQRIDLGTLLAGFPASEEAPPESSARPRPSEAGAIPDHAETKSRSKKKRKLLISDEPMSFDAFDDVNLDLRWTVDELLSPGGETRRLDFAMNLAEGRLTIGPLEAQGDQGGVISGHAELEPEGDAYRLRVELQGVRLRPDLISHGDDPTHWPPVDIDVKLAGVGASPHALAGSADGWLTVIVGEGRIDNSVVNLIAADVLVKLLGALDPFRKEEPFTRFECGVVHVELSDGKAVGDDLAIRTDKMTIVGDGRVDFKTEQLDLHWAAKPRKGVGISASAVTNPYIKLGGTLAEPAIEVKPLRAVTSTGVAVATLGVSILARGMYDRVSAEKKVCKQSLKKIAKEAAAREAEP